MHAEISVYPIGTDSTSVSFYVAKAVESIRDMAGLTHQITPMGTILESDRIDTILEASRQMTETVHRLGVKRVEVILKIDSRLDKNQSGSDKVESVKRHL